MQGPTKDVLPFLYKGGDDGNCRRRRYFLGKQRGCDREQPSL